jgi:hypothetical protein
MALIVQDRVKVNTTTTGTGTIVLGATAPTGYQSFAVIGNNNTTYYTIAGQTTNEWEVGVGTYYLANSSLSRDTILSSSNANAAVTFSAGTKDVFVTYPAERALYANTTNVTVFTDTLFALQDDADPTKQATFNIGTINTNNTIAYNLPTSATANTAVTLAGLNVAQTFNQTQSFSGGLSMSGVASNYNMGTSTTTGVTTIGGTATTSDLTVGRSTVSQTTNIQSAATTTGNTKTINIGANGTSGSTTAINIGSANNTTVTINGNVSLVNTLAVGSGGTGLNSLTNNSVMLGNATSSVKFVAPGTTGNVLTSDGTTWTSATPASTGALSAGNSSIVINNVNITANATIAAGQNGFSVGPVNTANGVTVTIASGQQWVVI